MLCGVLGCLCLIKSMLWREKKISLSGSEMEIFIHVCVVASGGLLLDIFFRRFVISFIGNYNVNNNNHETLVKHKPLT